jgi:hypothetical protein
MECDKVTLIERLRESMPASDLCNEAADEIELITKQRDELLAALEKLARLGNEPHYGNSIGNQIARDALSKGGA